MTDRIMSLLSSIPLKILLLAVQEFVQIQLKDIGYSVTPILCGRVTKRKKNNLRNVRRRGYLFKSKYISKIRFFVSLVSVLSPIQQTNKKHQST